MDTLNNICAKIIPSVVIHDTCGTCHALFTIKSIYNIQKSARNCQKDGKISEDDKRFKSQKKEREIELISKKKKKKKKEEREKRKEKAFKRIN